MKKELTPSMKNFDAIKEMIENKLKDKIPALTEAKIRKLANYQKWVKPTISRWTVEKSIRGLQLVLSISYLSGHFYREDKKLVYYLIRNYDGKYELTDSSYCGNVFHKFLIRDSKKIETLLSE